MSIEQERIRRREEVFKRIEQEETDKRRVAEIMEENRVKMEAQKRKQVR